MSEGRVSLHLDGVVATITFDRPEARNALTWSMYEQLADALDEVDADAALRVLVLRGAGGRAFVAGTDISQFTRFTTVDEGIAYERRIDDLIGRLEAVRIPTVAAIQGFAVGGGFAIACACDLRMCTPDAKLGLPIARTVGNCLSMNNYARIVALLGPSRARRMLLTAELLTAEEAHAAGFIMEVVDTDAFDERVRDLCETLVRNAPITLRVTKEAIRRILAAGVPDGSDLIRETYGSDDFREGVAAFLAKRQPEWKGR